MIDKEEKTVKDLDIDVSTNEEFFHKEESDEKIVIKDELNRILSSDELTAQGILFFIAGYDTTSAAISHCIYYLSQNKDCQRKLYEELQTITDFNYETLNKLKYLNAVIKETLRLAPPLVCIDRECLKDYKLGNTGFIN
jgi:cytochrome P450